MAFININGKVMNTEHVGTITPNTDELTITYVFEGGRKETEQFDSLEELSSKLQSISEL